MLANPILAIGGRRNPTRGLARVRLKGKGVPEALRSRSEKAQKAQFCSDSDPDLRPYAAPRLVSVSRAKIMKERNAMNPDDALLEAWNLGEDEDGWSDRVM